MENLKKSTFRYSESELIMLKKVADKYGLHQQQLMRMALRFLVNRPNEVISQNLLEQKDDYLCQSEENLH